MVSKIDKAFAEIQISNRPNDFLKVDLEYEEEFRKHNWSVYPQIVSETLNIVSRKSNGQIHWRDIMKDFKGCQINYKNGDNLDLRTENLDVLSSVKTDYKRVYRRSSGSFYAQVKKNGKSYYGKTRTTAASAARDADILIIKHKLNLADLNFPDSLSEYSNMQTT